MSRLRTRLESERRKWRETTKQKKRQDDQRDQQERKEADAEKKKGDEARRLSLKKPNKEQREAPKWFQQRVYPVAWDGKPPDSPPRDVCDGLDLAPEIRKNDLKS